MYMPVNLLNLFINNLLIIAPNTDPKGRTPIKIDWAVRESTDVILYSVVSVDMGTQVIDLRLYPNIIALSEMMNPTPMSLNFDLILFF